MSRRQEARSQLRIMFYSTVSSFRVNSFDSQTVGVLFSLPWTTACFPPWAHTAVVGLVSMARGLGETFDSRFFVTLSPDAKWADGRYSAFGQLNQADESMAVSSPCMMSGEYFASPCLCC